jgi:uncharacterized protein (DUF488 family)
VATSGRAGNRRESNAKALAAFGIVASGASHIYKVVREGGSVTVFTVGYEGRTGEDLIAILRDAGIEHLADIRDKPVSRKPDFRAKALMALCEDAGIEYGAWPDLGSTEGQRDRLQTTGDIDHFHKTFRAYAKRYLDEPVEKLARLAKRKSVALLCYERAHDDCHRSTIADLLADRLKAGVTAIL